MKLQRERPDDAARLVGKIRGYEIALQDDGFAYIAHHFPEARLISARLLWKGISKTVPKFNNWPESWGGNNDVFNAAWIKQHVQDGHGPLGEQYPSFPFRGRIPCCGNEEPPAIHPLCASLGVDLLRGRHPCAD